MKKDRKQTQEIADTTTPQLTEAMKEAFIRFLEYHPAKRFSKNLRKLLVEHLMCAGAVEADYLPHILLDLEGLFDLLDVAEEEWQG